MTAMEKGYTVEKNAQILISLMKKHGVRKVVASPGATNVCFVASIQQDPYFEVYSSVDERSAAYIACGLAEESGEAVALSCTGATASRNYVSGLTEAYYRKIPILAITSTQFTGRVGHNIPQVIDRSASMNDIQRLSVELPVIYSAEEEWLCCVKANEALLELKHHGGGPVHINLTTTYSNEYSCKELPEARFIDRICVDDTFPKLSGEKIAIIVGAHSKWEDRLTKLVDKFCEKYNAVVLYDHTSNYTGNYGVLANLITNQELYRPDCQSMDLLIHLGNVSGAYMTLYPDKVWRVNPDGEICDTFKKLEYVFEMKEEAFFNYYVTHAPNSSKNVTYAEEWKKEREKILSKIPDLPFSNIWIAQQMSKELPENSVLHLAILNSLRSWNLFDMAKSIRGYSNTGGFGIDGCVSSLIGASLANPEILYFGIIGDLAFFYDLNSIGNRHIGNNVRLLIINNGKGTEFRNYNHNAAKFGNDADKYIAAAGHFGNKSSVLLKHYAEDLGFKYYSASTKEEFLSNIEFFVSNKHYDQPILFEVFTSSENESDALKLVSRIDMGENQQTNVAKKIVKSILGESGVKTIKKIINK